MAKKVSGEFPFVHLGHGTSKVSDDYALWVASKSAPDHALRAWIESAMPASLRESAQEAGCVSWGGRVLHVRSGMDFRYVVQQYDPDHLDWLEGKREPLTRGDIDRIVSEVMDAGRGGPRDPKKSAWAAFDLDVELWLARVHAKCGVDLVVKDVQPKAAEQSKWHNWSAALLPALLPEIRDLLGSLEPVDGLVDFVHPLLRHCFRVCKPKTLSAEQLEICIDLLRIEGWGSEADLLALIVTTFPTKQRKPWVERLLRDRHPGVLGLCLEAKTRDLLLDDGIFELARERASELLLPVVPWTEVVAKQLGQTTLTWESHELGNPDHVTAKRVAAMRAAGPKTLEWSRRMFALCSANGALEREAETEKDTRYYRSILRDWNELERLLAQAMTT